MKDFNWSMVRSKCIKAAAASLVLLLLAGFCPDSDGLMIQKVHAAEDTNILRGKTATASSYMMPFEPGRAIDGSYDLTSRWVCANMNSVSGQWLRIDLGRYYTCNRWVVRGIGDEWYDQRDGHIDYSLGSYTLHGGPNGIPYSAVATGQGDTDQSVSRFTARYLQLKINEGNNFNNKWAAVREFEVYGFPTMLPTLSNNEPVAFVDEDEVSITTTIADDGGDNITEKGIVYSISKDPVIGGEGTTKIAAGSGSDPFTSVLTGLEPGTTYHVRAYAQNIMGIQYGKDISFNLSRAVNVALAEDIAEPVYGQQVRYMATVNVALPALNHSIPGGYVTFRDGETVLGTVPLTGNAAELMVSDLGAGVHDITAVYNGDTNNDANTSRLLKHTVAMCGTTTAVTSSSNPAVFGQMVTYTAALTANAPGSGTPTGTVVFRDGGSTLGTAALSGGTASYTTSAGAVATHVVTVAYMGDSNFNPSSSGELSQVITKAGTTPTVIVSPNPSVFGQPATYTVTVSATAPGAGMPTGTVTFKEGSTTLGTAALSGGTASYTTSAMSVGSHNITVSYGGNGNFSESTSALSAHEVEKAGTNITLTGIPNPSVSGEQVTYTATVSPIAPGNGMPTGTVTFKDGADILGTTALSGANAVFSTATGAAAAHNITAVYNGDGSFNGSTSAEHTQVIDKANTTVAVTSGVNPSAYGQQITYTINVSPVAPGSGIPTGTVTLKAGGSDMGTSALTGGSATVTASGLAAGIHNITAVYSGDGKFNGSGSTVFSQTVMQAVTNASVTISPDTSVFGQPVTYTAAVSPIAPGSGTPTGAVTFKEGSSTLGTVVLSGGQASFETSAAAVGTHEISALYNGDDNFISSLSASAAHTISRADTATSLIGSANPSAFGQPVTFIATVAAAAPGSGTPTGTVTFRNGADLLGTVTLAGGSADYTMTPAGIGNVSITAEYSGDAGFNPSTSPVMIQTVVQAATVTTVTGSPGPSVYGQPVNYTATVSVAAPGTGTPTGTVTFKAGETTLGTAELVVGIAQLAYPASPAGVHGITAVYSGDSSFAASTSSAYTQTVNKAAAVLNLSSTLNPSAAGEAVTFELGVSAAAPGSGVPTGTVIFKVGSDEIGTVSLSGGSAVLSLPGLAAGTHTITALYSGDSNFESGSSSGLIQTVDTSATSVALESSMNPSVYGQLVTYTAQVGSTASGIGFPAGTVTFRDGATILGTAALSGGRASLSISSAAVGSHSITAEYSGDSNYEGSVSAGFTQVINKAAVKVSVTSSLNPTSFGQNVVFTAEASAVAPGAGTPSGSFTFKAGSTSLGSALLSGGKASFSTAALERGNHVITVMYGGDESFAGAASSQYIHTVEPSAADKVAADKSALGIGFAVGDSQASVTRNLSFAAVGPLYGSEITWSSANAAIISNTGIVNRPSFAEGDAHVTVTAAVYNGDASDTKDFNLTVLKLEQIVHTVTFKDWDGSTIDTQSVAAGGSAAAPQNPIRPGYVFIGWDRSFSNVTADIIVTARYAPLPPALTDMDRVTADKVSLEIGFAMGDSAASVTQNLSLTVTGAVYGSDITWSSSNISVISNDGIVNRPDYYSGNAAVTMTAEIESNGVSEIKDFRLVVLRLPKPAGDSDKKAPGRDSGKGNNIGGNIPTDTTVRTTGGNPSSVEGKTTTATTVTKAGIGAGGTATAVFTTQQMSEVVGMAAAEAARQGEGVYKVVELKVDVDGEINNIQTTIPEASLRLLLQSAVDALTLTTPAGSITFDRGSMETLTQEAEGNIGISISKVDEAELSETVRQLVGARPVYDFGITGGGRSISQFNGYVTVSVPYVPRQGEDLDAIVIYYINAEGEAEVVRNCIYDSGTGTVSFTTDHFSIYAVGYNKVTFGDVDTDSWYSAAVDFIAARGITEGTGGGNYGPGIKLTRGQFIVLAMRTYGIGPEATEYNNFTDAGSTYYTGYLAAAKRLGIAKGTGDGHFLPDKDISRQEMFTLLYNTLDSMGKLPVKGEGKKLEEFEDGKMIAPWARKAMAFFAEKGIINGSSGVLKPMDTANRAEMAQIIYRLLSR